MADCEKYNCDCGPVDSQLNAYNSALEALASNEALANFDNLLADALNTLYNDKLKNLTYEPGENASQRPCNACGDCSELQSLLKTTLGEAKANAMISCCSPDPNIPGSDICKETQNPFGKLNSENNPCGQDADDQKSANLIPCNPFENLKADYTPIKLPKLKCQSKKDENAKCPEKIALSITQDGEVEINIPDVTTIQNTMEQLDQYLQNVSKALSYAKDGTGGAATSLKREACLNTLLNLMCEGKIKGKPGEGQLYGDRCRGAMKQLGCSGLGKNGKYAEDLCDQLKTDLAWGHTLTYGHMGKGIDGCPDNGKWPKEGENNNKENEIPLCDDGARVRTTEKAFVPFGAGDRNQQIRDAINSRLKELENNFPKGCGTPSSWPPDQKNLRAELEGQAGNGVQVTEVCNGGPCSCAPANFVSKEKAEQIAKLQEELFQKEVIIAKNQALIANKENELLLIPKPPKGIDATRETRLNKELNDLKTANATLLNESKVLSDQITLLRTPDPNNTGFRGECIEFQVSYCPANSTPKQSPNGGNAGNPNGGGKSGTEEKDYNHSNFYDMLRQLISATSNGNPCDASPLAAQINDCFGSQTGKSPFGGGVGGGDDSGPTLRPGGKGQPPGSPCSDNDGVDQMQSSGPCRGAGESNESFKNNMKRNRCVTRLNNIAQGLAKKLSNSGLTDNPIAPKMANLTRAVNSLAEALGKISGPKGDPSCSDFSLEEEVEAINKIGQKMERIIDGFARFKL